MSASENEWDYSQWGSARDPIHKSDLGNIEGKFGCLQSFARRKDEFARLGYITSGECNGKTACGTAVHEVLFRLCKSPIAVETMQHPTKTIGEHGLTVAFDEEFERERNGRPVAWFKTNADKHREECLSMLFGLVNDFRNHVAEVVLAEAGFVYKIAGVWLTGSIDLIYKAVGSEGVSMVDWKTGAQKPHQIELDHGWEAAIYGNALRDAWFIPYDSVEETPGVPHRIAMEEACIEIAEAWEVVMRFETEDGSHNVGALAEAENEACARLETILASYNAVKIGEYPETIRLAHLKDYVPYKRKSAPMLSRPEELAWAGLSEPGKFPREKGDARGPAWYHVNRTESHTPRMEHLLRSVVSWVRHGMFPPATGELCSRCKYQTPCLLEGYKPAGEERRRLDLITQNFDGFDGLGD